MQQKSNHMIVLGGHGVLGAMIADAAEAAGWTVIRTSRQPALGPGFRHVNLAEPDTLEKVIDEADVIVSTVPDEGLVAERMVLDRGGLLINVSAMANSAVQLLRGEPGPPRGTVLMNAGIAPGLTNLIAADLLARHPEADEVEMVFTVSAKGSVGPAGGDIGHSWLAGTRRHRTTVIRLPEPFGRRRCLGAGEQNNGWLGAVASGRTVSTYLCMTERRMQRGLLAVNAAGLIGRLPRSAFATSPVAEATSEPVRHWVAVRRRGSLLAASTLRCQGDYRNAAVSTVLTAGHLTRRAEPAPAGVLIPEEVLTIGELLPALAEAGITVVEE
jgi:NAD(P)-dependent dehydrogenase (short-subunit alcohol dehydrogenase family)